MVWLFFSKYFKNLERISADFGVPESLVGRIQVGKTLPIQVPALQDRTFLGRISEVGAAAKEGARLFKVVIQLDNRERLLKSGMTASVVLNQSPEFPAGAVVVPLSALVGASRGNPDQSLAVYVVDNQGKAHERPVVTDEIVRSSIVITSGLAAGERVVTSGASLLYEGAAVEILPAETL